MLGTAQVSSPNGDQKKKRVIPKPECQHWWFDDLDKEAHCLYCGVVRYEMEKESNAQYFAHSGDGWSTGLPLD